MKLSYTTLLSVFGLTSIIAIAGFASNTIEKNEFKAKTKYYETVNILSDDEYHHCTWSLKEVVETIKEDGYSVTGTFGTHQIQSVSNLPPISIKDKTFCMARVFIGDYEYTDLKWAFYLHQNDSKFTVVAAPYNVSNKYSI